MLRLCRTTEINPARLRKARWVDMVLLRHVQPRGLGKGGECLYGAI
jgi:hypothetical protein